MNTVLPLPVAGTTLLLLADKAAYWPEQQALLIADAHFGKAAAYRALGQPVPHGTTAANLRRIDKLLAQYACRQVIFLGDFLHAPASHAAATLAALADWRSRHAQLACLLIRGNHDLRAGDPPAYLDIGMVSEPYVLEPFALCHMPVPQTTHHVIAGHLHPAYRLQGKGRQSLRLPCFYSEQGLTLLPAFGDFTGGMDIKNTSGRRIFVVHDGGIWLANGSATPASSGQTGSDNGAGIGS